MLGLMVLLALGAYLAITALVVWLAVRWAKQRQRRPWVWGGLAAFVMYNLVFWDWIPTLVVHKYYCATESGFWVYKTPEQWAIENLGVSGTLIASPARSESMNGGWHRYWLNRRIYWDDRRVDVFHAIGRTDKILRDVSSGETLGRSTGFWRGASGNVLGLGGSPDQIRQSLIFSLGDRWCGTAGTSFDDQFNHLVSKYYKIGGQQ